MTLQPASQSFQQQDTRPPATATPTQPYFPTAEESRRLSLSNRGRRLVEQLEEVQLRIERATYQGVTEIVFSNSLEDEILEALKSKGYCFTNIDPFGVTPKFKLSW